MTAVGLVPNAVAQRDGLLLLAPGPGLGGPDVALVPVPEGESQFETQSDNGFVLESFGGVFGAFQAGGQASFDILVAPRLFQFDVLGSRTGGELGGLVVGTPVG